MSTIPGVMDRLVQIARTALPEHRVDDGVTGDFFEEIAGVTRGVVVGWQGDEGAAVEAEIDRQGAAGDDREVYRVYCVIILASGDTETTALREQAFADFARLRGEIRAQHPIYPGVLRSFVDFVDLAAGPVTDGVQVMLRFAVGVDAFSR